MKRLFFISIFVFFCTFAASLSAQTLQDYNASIDKSCESDSDCAVKDVHNCCGYYPGCVNVKAKTDPAKVAELCAAEGLTGVCGFEDISNCHCNKGSCEPVQKTGGLNFDQINYSDVSVLVVDDMQSARDLNRQYLLKMGFSHIDMAASSAEAESQISPKKYDIIFLDWNMPGKSGLALLQEYRENRSFDHVAFVMVSANTADTEIKAALKSGATAYIIKHTIPKEFQPKVRIALEWMTKMNPKFRNKTF